MTKTIDAFLRTAGSDDQAEFADENVLKLKRPAIIEVWGPIEDVVNIWYARSTASQEEIEKQIDYHRVKSPENHFRRGLGSGELTKETVGEYYGWRIFSQALRSQNIVQIARVITSDLNKRLREIIGKKGYPTERRISFTSELAEIKMPDETYQLRDEVETKRPHNLLFYDTLLLVGLQDKDYEDYHHVAARVLHHIHRLSENFDALKDNERAHIENVTFAPNLSAVMMELLGEEFAPTKQGLEKPGEAIHFRLTETDENITVTVTYKGHSARYRYDPKTQERSKVEYFGQRKPSRFKKLTLENKINILAAIGGAYHGYCDAKDIPIQSEYVENFLTYVPACITGALAGLPAGIAGLMGGISVTLYNNPEIAGKEPVTTKELAKAGATVSAFTAGSIILSGTITAAITGGITAVGYGVGYGLGKLM